MLSPVTAALLPANSLVTKGYALYCSSHALYDNPCSLTSHAHAHAQYKGATGISAGVTACLRNASRSLSNPRTPCLQLLMLPLPLPAESPHLR